MKESNINAGVLLTVPQVGVFGLVVRVTQSMGRVLIEDMGVLDHLNTRGIDVGIIAVTQAISQKVTEAL